MNQTIKSLSIFNPFFNRNQKIVNVCLLKIGRIIQKHGGCLYKLGQELPYFYIILSGKVKLTNGGLKQICKTGQTILQEVIFSDRDKKISLQRAKVIGESYFLELNVQQYKNMKEEMIRHRFKVEMQEMQSVIKRNYIVKNWMRNKARAQ